MTEQEANDLLERGKVTVKWDKDSWLLLSAKEGDHAHGIWIRDDYSNTGEKSDFARELVVFDIKAVIAIGIKNALDDMQEGIEQFKDPWA
jgi:hypothetical protein